MKSLSSFYSCTFWFYFSNMFWEAEQLEKMDIDFASDRLNNTIISHTMCLRSLCLDKNRKCMIFSWLPKALKLVFSSFSSQFSRKKRVFQHEMSHKSHINFFEELFIWNFWRKCGGEFGGFAKLRGWSWYLFWKLETVLRPGDLLNLSAYYLTLTKILQITLSSFCLNFFD